MSDRSSRFSSQCGADLPVPKLRAPTDAQTPMEADIIDLSLQTAQNIYRSNKSMKWSDLQKHLKLAWLLICLIFVWGAAANTGIGFSAFIFGIPFMWLLFAQSRHLQKWSRNLLLVCALLPIIAAIVIPASTSHLHYPAIGAKVVIPAGWGSVTYSNEYASYLESPENLSKEKLSASSRDRYQISVFPSTVTTRISGVNTQHPDFGLAYYVVLEAPTGETYQIYEQKFFTAIKSGRLIASDLNGEEVLHNPLMKHLGDLMYWPAVPLLAATWVRSEILSNFGP